MEGNVLGEAWRSCEMPLEQEIQSADGSQGLDATPLRGRKIILALGWRGRGSGGSISQSVQSQGFALASPAPASAPAK